jgi:predicted SAM-dependent methyltransferase
MINLGSGQRPFEKPFINIDIQPEITVDGVIIKPDIIADLAKPLPFGDNSVDLAVAHQVLEHLDAYREGQDFIKEVYRFLKPGGSFIVTVPDLRALANKWLTGQISDYIYMTNLYGAWMGSEYDRHKHGYCWEELCGKLMCAGWRTIKGFDGRVIAGADIAQDWWILAVEAVK